MPGCTITILHCNEPIKLSVDNCCFVASQSDLRQRMLLLQNWASCFSSLLVVDGKSLGWQIMAVSPSLLAGVKPVLEDWIPPRELLLGMGEPWEPFPWDPCYDTENLNVDLLAASQQYEAVLQNSIDEENIDRFLLAASQDYEKSTEVSSRWAPPMDSSEISTLWKSGVPQKTQNQTNWALRVPTKESCRRWRDVTPTSRQFCWNG